MPIHYELGETLKAERIAARARKWGNLRVEQGSSSHRIQTSMLEGDAYCVIEKPLRGVKRG